MSANTSSDPPRREVTPRAPSADGKRPAAERRERIESEARQSPSARIIHNAILLEGDEELARPTRALAWSGLASGLSIGFSFLAQALLADGLPDARWAHLVSAFGYSIGFLIVVLGRQQLFTENTLTPVLPWLHDMRWSVFRRVLRLWAIVLVTNIVGAFLFAWLLGLSDSFEEGVRTQLTAIGVTAISRSPWATLTGAIFAGWLIALMVWLLPFAEAARFWVVLVIAYLVGLGGFAHVIAGSSEVAYLVIHGDVSLLRYARDFLLPALTGNVIGGVTLVALLNHAQVTAGGDDEEYEPHRT